VAYRDLRDFIHKLEKEGELLRITAQVDPVLEISEITDRVTKAGGPALLFTNPKGSRHPLLINMLGSERRVNLALQVNAIDEVAARIHSYLPAAAGQSPQGLFEKLKMLPKLAEIGAFFPKSVKTGPCKEVIRKEGFSLLEFPIQKCWPQDGGRFITWPLVITRNPETGRRNVGVYRMQVFDERTTAMHWQTQKHGAEHFRLAAEASAQAGLSAEASAQAGLSAEASAQAGLSAEALAQAGLSAEVSAQADLSAEASAQAELSRARVGADLPVRPALAGRMPVAVAIGSDPATCLAGVLPVPPDMDEMMFAGFLRRAPVEMTACETVDLEVPANAEIVLEGYVDLGELRTEGPFGDHTGFYSLEGPYPVFHVTCLTHRQDPLYLGTLVGPPPQEDYFLGHAIERMFLPVMKMQYPEIVDIAMPAEGIFHNLMMVSIRKSYPGHARKIMSAIWSLGQAMFTKVVVVVDHDVNVQNSREVLWKALCAIDPQRDIEFTLGPVDTLDHAARGQDFGSKMGIDATRKWASEGFTRPWPDQIVMSEEVKRRVDRIWGPLGLPLRPKS